MLTSVHRVCFLMYMVGYTSRNFVEMLVMTGGKAPSFNKGLSAYLEFHHPGLNLNFILQFMRVTGIVNYV